MAWLRAEGGVPIRCKSAYLTDAQIYELVDYAAWLRSSHKRDQDRTNRGPQDGPEDGPVAGSVVA